MIRSEQQFVKSLLHLVALPGNLVVLPHSILDVLWNEIGWEVTLTDVPGLLGEEVHLARAELERWEALGRRVPERSIVGRLRRAWAHLRSAPRAADAS